MNRPPFERHKQWLDKPVRERGFQFRRKAELADQRPAYQKEPTK